MDMEVEIDPTTNIRASARISNLRSGMEDLAAFAKKAAELEGALDRLADLTGEESRRSVSRLKAQLSAFEPSVTVLGQVKSGKTSLINAMTGWPDLLPSDVNPWTSVVTSLHLTPANENAETGARFQFMTEDEWDRLTTKGGRIGELAGRAGAEGELQKIRDQIHSMREKSRRRLGRNFELLMGQEHEFGYFDKNMLERYICLGDDFDVAGHSSAQDEQGRFADITRSAELYLNCHAVPFRMCLRDTPGVNDTFMMREMMTIKAIRDSRICVVVLSASQALSSVDMALVRMIATLKSREVIIFVNRIDELPEPANQMIEIEESIRRTLKNNDGPQDAKIIFGSAYWAGRVLHGELGEMADASAGALLNLTEAVIGTTNIGRSPSEHVWELSGLPALMQALSSQFVLSLGEPCLTKIASSAMAIATSQNAMRTVLVEGDDFSSDVNMHEIRTEFERIAEMNLTQFKASISEIFAEYHKRVDRVHENFIERATHSLLSHLEVYGAEHVWEYDPSGLRLLLRSAYSTMGSRVRKKAEARYETAVSDTAHLLYRGFGPAVEGIQLSVPSVPQIPSPVTLGQTIALDFNDSWWAMWWRRRRGYQAFTKQFRELIRSETEDFMTQVKDAQTSTIHDDLVEELRGFLDQQKAILLDLITGAHRSGGAEDMFCNKAEQKRNDALNETLRILGRYIT